ncbi:hypothetical protein BDV27DRAFT_171188 [Aspergillus caelatus]|uniref:BTB domain-containing protein n=1 Tax=Aspergillus caelatus TaxID=61420 RepID=A0A5N7ABS7_9EURO|nr:uncharacterized protein BDV27DRAFT_171188 [Aspergillus caelatus]KAE8366050.1 hypothetical protein BDV27DRAFT_171188 [Aspergillus caelatus]
MEDLVYELDHLVYELDPKGDIFLILDNVSKDLPDNLRDLTTSSGWPDGLSNPTPPESDQHKAEKSADRGGQNNEIESTNAPECTPRRRLQIRVSSKHLVLACPQFERSLQDGFEEGTTLKATGSLQFPVQDWEAIPFLILMLIIHHRARMVPREVSLARLVEIARLVDYYECYEAVEPFSGPWLINLKIKSLSSSCWIPSLMDEAEKWILVSWVFKEAKPFQDASIYLESESTGIVSFSGLPGTHAIQDAINSSRRALISGIIKSMNNLFSTLRDGPKQCSEGCDCALLGALTKGMHRIGILSLNSTSSFEGISFTQLAHDYSAAYLERLLLC